MDELVYCDSALIALLKQYHRTRRLKPSAGQFEIMMPRQHPHFVSRSMRQGMTSRLIFLLLQSSIAVSVVGKTQRFMCSMAQSDFRSAVTD